MISYLSRIFRKSSQSTKDTQVIANQAREISALKDELKQYKSAIKDVRSIMYCMGGPLNDNFLQFNREQVRTFWQIACKLEGL